MERKFAIFNGGFLSSHVLDSPYEITLFFLTLLLAQATIIAIILLPFLKTSKKNKVIVYYNFIFFTLALNAILLGLKYKLLSYFSDAVSFELIKNLGGGSILDALLYIIDEAVLILVVILAITGLYWLGYKLISNIKYLNELIPPERNIKKYPLTSKIIYFTSFFFILVASLLLSNQQRDIKYGLNSFLSYNLINSVFSQITDFDRDNYSYFTSPSDKFPFDATKYPFALDRPNNGIDEDGLLGDLKFHPPQPTINITIPPNQKNFVLIVLESARGDLLEKKLMA